MGWRTRIGEWLDRRFARPAPKGRWIEGRAFAWRGLIGFRPWVFPRRGFRLYVPGSWSGSAAAPLLVLVHGCRQTPEEFARGTRIEAAAERAGLLVLMPDQKDSANPYRCWNWFDRRTAAGKGEAAIVAAMIRKVARRFGADRSRVTVAGMSSGAALSAVLGVRFPQLVRGVFAHSGLACGAAASAFTALTVMRRGPEGDVAAIAREARESADGDVRVSINVVQGGDDDVVARLNAEALARQYLALNGVDVPAGANSTLPEPQRTRRDASAPHAVRTREWDRDGRAVVRVIDVAGLGHAWSGGDAALPFNDAAPPEATAMLVAMAVGTAQ
jgi:poly(hydroxyalkanoate) depolymerase family esterase